MVKQRSTPEPTVIRPQPGPQEAFLESSADICIYGGGAGSGKSFALLIDPLRHISRVQGFGAVIFRRSFPEITNEGGLWDESSRLYPLMRAKPIVGNLEWRFPPFKNTISFRHLQHESTKHDWQGSQIAMVGFDELSHFTESTFFYMLSRNRSVCGIKPYVRATTNPDPGWVKRFLAPWVDTKYEGVPARSGEIRWFVRVGGRIQFVPEGTPDAKSLTFIKATVFDNKILLEKNPEYLANLKALPPVEQARLLYGDWDVKREGLVYPGFESCFVDRLPPNLSGRRVGGIDFGWRHPFASPWGVLDDRDVLWITNLRYKSFATLPDHSAALPKDVSRWWCDPAQPGLIAELKRGGHECVPCVHLAARGSGGGKRNPIMAGVDMVSQRIRTNRLKILRPACGPLYSEFCLYHFDPEVEDEEPVKEQDDALDALRYLITGLDRNRYVDNIYTEQDEIDHVEKKRLEVEEVVATRKREAAEMQARRHADPEDDFWWNTSGM